MSCPGFQLSVTFTSALKILVWNLYSISQQANKHNMGWKKNNGIKIIKETISKIVHMIDEVQNLKDPCNTSL